MNNEVTDLVVEYLNSVNIDSIDTRRVRAALTAQILSSLVPLELGTDLGDLIETTEKAIKPTLSAINERIQIDPMLTIALFGKALRIRHDIIYAPTNLDAIRATLTGDAVSANLTPEVSDILGSLGGNSGYLIKTRDVYKSLLDTGLFTELLQPANNGQADAATGE